MNGYDIVSLFRHDDEAGGFARRETLGMEADKTVIGVFLGEAGKRGACFRTAAFQQLERPRIFGGPGSAGNLFRDRFEYLDACGLALQHETADRPKVPIAALLDRRAADAN